MNYQTIKASDSPFMDIDKCQERQVCRMDARWRLGFSVLLLAAIVGCGAKHDLVPVTGTVTYQGTPLEYGTITFVSPNARQASGEIANGTIQGVTTYDENDGLAPGEHQIAITALDRSEKYRNSMVPRSLIPRRYADFATSGLRATIKSGKNEPLQLDLE